MMLPAHNIRADAFSNIIRPELNYVSKDRGGIERDRERERERSGDFLEVQLVKNRNIKCLQVM